MSSITDPPSSSRPSLAIIITCSVIGGLVVLFVFVRLAVCLHRRRVLKSLPLPPVRPLTIHHNSSWDPAASRSQLKLNEGYLDHSPSFGAFASSDRLVSRTPSSPLGLPISRHQSMSDEMPLRQPSPITPLSPHYADQQLAPPQPLFFLADAPTGSTSNRSSAQVSLNSVTEESALDSYPPHRPSSMMAFPVQPADSPRAPQPQRYSVSGLPDRVSSPSFHQPRERPRPMSISSIRTTETMKSMRSMRSVSTIRGAPHRPHSRIDIILPAPLAPQTYPYAHAEGFDSPDLREGFPVSNSNRQSVCDPWINVGREATSSPVGRSRPEKLQKTHDSRRVSQTRSSRLSLSSSSSHATASNLSSAIYSPSSASSLSTAVTQPKSSVELSSLPPVPRVPSIYYNSSSSPSPVPASRSESGSREELQLEAADKLSSYETAPEDEAEDAINPLDPQSLHSGPKADHADEAASIVGEPATNGESDGSKVS